MKNEISLVLMFVIVLTSSSVSFGRGDGIGSDGCGPSISLGYKGCPGDVTTRGGTIGVAPENAKQQKLVQCQQGCVNTCEACEKSGKRCANGKGTVINKKMGTTSLLENTTGESFGIECRKACLNKTAKIIKCK